jgi:nucleotide-binding universal stress UspA family protein
MEPIKEIIVGLDMSDLDLTLIEFAKVVARRDSVEKIHFYHRIKKQTIPDELRKEFPEMIDKYTEDSIGKIKARVEKVFDSDHGIELEYRVEEGNVATLVNMAIEAAVDLIIIGRKKSSGTGMLGQRLARRATCNILIVPEDSVPEVRKMLLPIDFSKYTKLALETAIDIAENQPKEVEIICQNVYYVPVGYHYTGKSYDEVAEIMRSNAENKYERFIQKVDTRGLNVSAVYSLDVNDDLSSDIYDVADEIKPDVIVIGAKGRTAAASLLLGSMAEKLITKYMAYPLLIVRPKGKSAGIIETFRDIE